MKFLKTRNVRDPERKEYDAGIDFFVAEFSIDYLKDICLANEYAVTFGYDTDKNKEYINVLPHMSIKIPSGLKCRFPKSIALILQNKSSIAHKKHLDIGASVIDSSYEGEFYICLTNSSDYNQKIYFGEKIVQGVPFLIDTSDIEVFDSKEITSEEFYKRHTKSRGEGGFGSTLEE